MSLGQQAMTGPTSSAPEIGLERTYAEFPVIRLEVPDTVAFGHHIHDQYQLSWAREGLMDVTIGDQRYTLGSEHVLWIPGATLHDLSVTTPGELFSAYGTPDAITSAPPFDRPRVIKADTLITEALIRLADRAITERRRGYLQLLMFDLLMDAPDAEVMLPMPRDPRARTVAGRILANVMDQRELRQWAVELGVSTKTLARSFAETSFTFSQWRTRARVYTSLIKLERGESVESVALASGYTTASSFITAFKSVYDSTPARYLRERKQALRAVGLGTDTIV